MKTLLNKLISAWCNKKFKKQTWKPLSKETEEIFQRLGTGILNCNIRSTQSNFISKVIGFFSTYREYNKSVPISHNVCIYFGDITKLLEGHPVEKSILENRISKYYKNPPLLSEIKALVLCSADDNGMNYFDFSKYQNRDFSLRPLLADYKKQRSITCDFIRQFNKPYDYTGLVFWPLYRIFKFMNIFDDSKSWFCSEVNHEILKRHGIRLCNKNNPSPADTEYANKYAAFKYRTKGFLR